MPFVYAANGVSRSLAFAVVCLVASSAVGVSADDVFVVQAPRMKVQIEGSGAGVVMGHGINCGPVCEATFYGEFKVTVAATAEPGSRFTGWSGGGCSGTGLCTVTMTADTTVTAEFVPIRLHIHTISRDANGQSVNPAVSADGRFVVFESAATNLSKDCTTRVSQIYLRDQTNGTMECVSRAPDGMPGNADSTAPAISADGRLIAFESEATNRAAPCSARGTQIYVRDRLTGATVCVSISPEGTTPGDGASRVPALSSDGRFLAFESTARNLVGSGCTTGISQIFLRDLAAGTTTCVSRSPDGAPGNGDSVAPAVSADGRFVVFESKANNLAGPCGPGPAQVFLRDRSNATTTCVSVGPDGSPGNGPSREPSLSHDGRFVAFESAARNLVPSGCTTGERQVFLRDRAAQTMVCLSVAPEGAAGNAASGSPSLSTDGSVVAFESTATNLTPSCTTGVSQIFVRSLTSGVTRCASVSRDGTPGNAPSQDGVMANPGLEIAFQSHAGNLNSSPADPSPRGGISRVLYATTLQPWISSPRNGQEFPVGPSDPPEPITFSWTSLAGVSRYLFEFTGPDAQFTNPNGTGPDGINGFGGAGGGFLISGTSAALPDLGPADYQVRVIGTTSASEFLGTFSDAVNISIEPPIGLPPDVQPAITTPLDGSTVARGTPITFSWTPLPGVTQYGFEFTGVNRQFANPNGTAPDPVNGLGGAGGGFPVAGTSLPAVISPDSLSGHYQVRVIGLSRTGVVGSFSDAVTIVID